MKLLMIYCDNFSYVPKVKNLKDTEEISEGKNFKDTQVAFIQVESEDENPDRLKSVERKMLNFTKWVARKNNTKNIILHSFAHLSESKASPEFTKELFDRVESRLSNVGYNTSQTPFGYFLDLDIKAPGFSLARVFKSFD